MEIKGTDRKLNIASLNIQGLRNAKRRKAIFRQLKKNKYDIIAIQEAYLLKEDIPLIQRDWGGPFHISEGTKHSKGLLTLFSKDFTETDINALFINDRVIISTINFDDNLITIVNIYGPCGEREKPVFLNDLKRIISMNVKNEEEYMVILGDTNIVQSNKLDIISGACHSKNSVTAFNEFIDHFELNDIWRGQNQNSKEYTWSKYNRIASTFIARRLDYILANGNLVPYCQEAGICGIGFSDHRAVTLSFNFSAFKRGPPIFKLNVELLKDINFVNQIKGMIEETKDTHTELDPHLLWELLKINIKSAAISYGKKRARELKINKNNLQEKLAEAEELLAKKPTDESLQTKMYNLKTQLEVYLLKEAEGARIRAGIKWAERGEKTNSWFLSLEKQRARNDTIFRLSNEHNEIVKKSAGILELLTCHFENLYMQPTNLLQDSVDDIFCIPDQDRHLQGQEADPLEVAITDAELHSALKSMKNGSSPGMDGIPVEVFKVLWLDLKDSFLKNILYSFETNSLSFTQSHGLIKLIYKGNGADREKIPSWRPISLLNSDYKVIAKLIAKRLNTVIHKLIDPNQYAFIKGRNGGDMIREIDDIIELEKLKGRKSILLSIDYAKAFDTLSTNAILKALRLYGLKENFLKWIEILLSEKLSCIKNNNDISRFFQMQRGVRQGCPLSPLLFICTVELLARNIRNDNNIKGIITCKNSRPVKIKAFADDTTLFCKDQMDFREVLSKIKLFTIFSGLELNEKKSMAMILDSNNTNIIDVHNIKIVNKVKILGIYLSNKAQPGNLDENFSSKIDRLEQLCKNWSKRNLSIVGKIIIIKTFGISLFTHIINSIGINDERIVKINQIIFRFIWGKSMAKTKTTEKVKRSVICKSKQEGGLNMVDLKHFQEGFYLKWAEQLLNNEYHPWKSTAKAIFQPIGGLAIFKSKIDIKEIKGIELVKSLFWRRVLETWIKLNNYKKQDSCGIDPSTPLFNNSKIRYKKKVLFLPQLIKRNIYQISDITRNGQILSLQEVEMLLGTYPGIILDYNVLFNALKPYQQQIRDIRQEDIGDQNVYFNNMIIGKIGRKKLMKHTRSNIPPNVENKWTTHLGVNIDKERWLIPFKTTKEVRLQVLQWKVLHNIYPTAILLSKMGVRPTDQCNECGTRETLTHFFYECKTSRAIWRELENIIASQRGKRVKIDNVSALLGYIPGNKRGKKHCQYINLAIMIGKMVISKLKYGPKRNPLELLEFELESRQIICKK